MEYYTEFDTADSVAALISSPRRLGNIQVSNVEKMCSDINAAPPPVRLCRQTTAVVNRVRPSSRCMCCQ